MKIHIEGNIYLESDEYQYILREYTGKFTTYNKGKENEYEREIFKLIGYYPTVEHAVNKLFEIKVKETTANTLSELLEDMSEIRKYVEGLFKDEKGAD